MLRIIKSTIETLRADGIDCGLKIGEKWITSDISDVQYPLFVFDPLTYKINNYDFSKEYTLKFVIGYENNQDEQDDVMNIETVEYCETVLQKFLIALTTYVNSSSQYLITMPLDCDIVQFHDLNIWGLPLSGLIVTAYATKQQANQC